METEAMIRLVMQAYDNTFRGEDDGSRAAFELELRKFVAAEKADPRDPRATLALAEIEYLLANGWSTVGPDDWKEPEGRKDRVLNHGHAVNSQKALDNTLGARVVRTPGI